MIENAVISDDVADQFFVCELSKCKGACCVEGDIGAPLEVDELQILKDIWPQVRPYLTQKGIEVIEKEGVYVMEEGEAVTPTINHRECAYAVYDEKSVLKCGIEQAYLDKKIDFPKPISCHLYPIRITKYDEYDALNYDRWNICSPACYNGKTLGVPVYQFLKAPLIRKYGEDWYRQLANEIESNKSNPN